MSILNAFLRSALGMPKRIPVGLLNDYSILELTRTGDVASVNVQVRSAVDLHLPNTQH